VNAFVFSSTCATYGIPNTVPIPDDHSQNPINPYGESKFFIERILRQYDRAYGLRFVGLRYFNACGASFDGSIGEAHDPETHLIPRILRVAKGDLEKIQVFGYDYSTPDGTCIRDYIHVVDLARAHVAALKWLEEGNSSDFFNLGTGRGYSVLQVLKTAEAITGRKVHVEKIDRREGDPPQLIADPSKAMNRLDWKAVHSDLETILGTAWNWEVNRRF
jgi:UDP-glucose 4-epimerase